MTAADAGSAPPGGPKPAPERDDEPPSSESPETHPFTDEDLAVTAEEQPTLQALDRRVRITWWITGGAWAAAVVIAAAAAWFTDPLEPRPPGFGAGLTVIAAGAVLLAAVLPWLRYRRWRYALAGHGLWIRHGLVWVSLVVVPYTRLQFVDTTCGPLDRWLGLARLVVHTAAPGTSATIPGLDEATAERLRASLAASDRDEGTL